MERIRSDDILPSGYEVESAAFHPHVSRVARVKNRVKTQLRRDPIKWAGIAAASGLGLGLLGRYVRYRAKARKRPQLFLIEGAC